MRAREKTYDRSLSNAEQNSSIALHRLSNSEPSDNNSNVEYDRKTQLLIAYL